MVGTRDKADRAWLAARGVGEIDTGEPAGWVGQSP